jgi:hypothetical protein
MTHDPAKLTPIVCAVLAVLAFAAFPIAGWPVAAGVAIGLIIGSANGLLARRALGSGLPFTATSLARLGTLSAAALAAGFLLGAPAAPVFGVAIAQLVLALASVFSLARR